MNATEVKLRWKGLATETIQSGDVARVRIWSDMAAALVNLAIKNGTDRVEHWRNVAAGIQEALDDNADRD